MRKKQHLIAIDLDGTLLTDNKQISAETKAIIKHIVAQGHVVVIATGRSNHLSLHYYHELVLNTPLIHLNGAVLHQRLDNKRVNYHTQLQHHTVLDMNDIS